MAVIFGTTNIGVFVFTCGWELTMYFFLRSKFLAMANDTEQKPLQKIWKILLPGVVSC